MKKPMAIMLAVVIVLFGGVFAWIEFKQYMIDKYLASYTAPPVTVSAAPAAQEQWQGFIKSVGTIRAENGVDISSEVGGLVRTIHFSSGSEVKEGEILVQLDDSVEQANLRSFHAQYELAKINFERDKKLLKNRAISKTDFDTVEAQLKDALAQVERTRALIEQKRIHAPFSGRLGVREINVGDYVSSGDHLVTLQAHQLLYIDFYVPEKYVPKLFVGQRVEFNVQAFDDKHFVGVVSAINSKVDQNTRNILVRASYNNQDGELVPGMFANVSIILSEVRDVVVVPQTAISYSLYGSSVFVVNAKTDENGNPLQVVERRYIQVGERRDKRVALLAGIKAGEIVVTAGQIKLTNGAKIKVDNSIKL